MPIKPPVVTFYSYKGGVGRTTSLANVAYLLAHQGLKVFLWDFDLDAPNLHSLVRQMVGDGKSTSHEIGFADYLIDWENQGFVPESLDRYISTLALGQSGGSIEFLSAGFNGTEYVAKLAQIRWEDFYTRGGLDLLRHLIDQITERAPDVILLDARTGLTDLSFAAVLQLADLAVLFYRLNPDGVEGILSARELFRRREPPLSFLYVASMVPFGDFRRAEVARAFATSQGLRIDVEIPAEMPLLLVDELYARTRGELPLHPLTAQYEMLTNLIWQRIKLAGAFQPRSTIGVGSRSNRAGEDFADRVAGVYRLLGYEVSPTENASTFDLMAVNRRGGANFRMGIICVSGELSVEKIERIGPLGHLNQAVAVTRVTSSPGVVRTAEARGIGVISYDELLSGLADFTPIVRAQIDEFEQSRLADLYVSQDLTFEGKSGTNAAEIGIERFLRNPTARFLTILGDFGTGKTSLTRKLARDLGRRYLEDPLRSPAPVRIDLKDVGKALGLEDLLVNYLGKVGLTLSFQAVLLLIEEGRLILLFDGFDEMATAASAEITRQNLQELARTAIGRSKTILTSRTHYFRDRQEVEPLASQPASTTLAREIERGGFEIAYLREFDAPRIAAYVSKVTPDRAQSYLDQLDEIPGLRDLARRPIFLEMVVGSLPSLVGRGSAVSVASLYQEYAERWLQREDWRLQLTRDGKERLVEELARRLWEEETSSLHYSQLGEVLARHLRQRIQTTAELEIAAAEVRTAVFLRRDDQGNYSFAHRSFLEFFLARQLAHRLAEDDWGALDLRRLSREVIEFLERLANPAMLVAGCERVLAEPYRKRVSENALLVHYWLVHRSEDPQSIHGTLHQDRSICLNDAMLDGVELPGINLVGAELQRADLTRTDLAGARLLGANLKGARLVSSRLTQADMCGADLTGADLTAADLAGADFSLARLRGCRLGIGIETTLEGAWVGKVAPRRDDFVAMPPLLHSPNALAFHPDGLILASVGNDGAVRLWETASGREARRLEGHVGSVRAVAYSPDGLLLVSAGNDGTVRLWEAASGREKLRLEDCGGAVRTVAFSPDGQLLVVGGSDGTVGLFDTSNGREIRKLQGHVGSVRAVAYSPDGRLFASGGDDKAIRLWEGTTGQEVGCLAGHGGSVQAMAFSPDGRLLATGGDDNTIRLWESTTGQEVRRLAGHHGSVLAVAFSPDGRLMATGGSDKAVRLWDPVNWSEARRIEGHSGPVWAMAFAGPDGRLLATGGGDGTVRLWETASGGETYRIEGCRIPTLATVAFSPDGLLVATGGEDGSVQMLETTNGPRTYRLEGYGGAVMAVAFSPDGQRLATGGDDGAVRVWDISKGQEVIRLVGQSGSVMAVAFSPDGRLLATGSEHSIQLWDSSSGRQKLRLDNDRGPVLAVAFSPNGHLLAIGGDDGVRIWEVSSSSKELRPPDHRGRVMAVAFSPDGWLLATGGDDGTIRLWDANDRSEFRQIKGHGDPIQTVAFSPDGRTLASGGSVGVVRLWEVATGDEQWTLMRHRNQVLAVAFGPNGRLLASAGNDGTLRLWSIADREQKNVAIYLLERGDWLICLADGRFDASAGGFATISFSEGLVNYTADGVRDLFYDPTAIKSAFATLSAPS